MKKLILIFITFFVVNCTNAQKAELAKNYHNNGTLESLGKQYPAKELKFGNKQQDDIYKNSPWLQLKPLKVGEWKWYHKNGKLKTKGFYSERKDKKGEISTYKDKKWDNYYESGNLESSGSYTDGRKMGIWKTYYDEDGKIFGTGSQKGDWKVGEWKYQHRNGKLFKIGNYEKGKETGIWKRYYDTGELYEISSFLNGELNKEVKVYHKNGKLYVLRTYANGKSVGEGKWYHENGTLQTEGNYSNNLQIGEWKRYNDNGTLNNIEMYFNINKNASLENVELRAVSGYKANSKKETRVILKFKSSNAGATLYPPGSSSAFYLKDDQGNQYKLIRQENWPGGDANGFGRTNKSIKNLSISLIFENVPLDKVKKLDLIEGDNSKSKGWHFYNLLAENRTVNYASDECVSGDCKNGTGVFKWSNGDKYEGAFERGGKHGKGVFYASNGDRYDGEFRFNEKDGKGISIFKNGEKFVGRYERDRMDYGTYSYGNGDKYNGSFSGGIPSSRGTYTYANGAKYIGQFKNGKFEGYGSFTGNDEDMFVGLWKGGLKHGDGIHYLSTGDIYIGRYENDKRKEGKTYTTAIEKNKIVDKYLNGSVKKNYSQREIAKKKKESFEKIFDLMLRGSQLLTGKQWPLEDVDYKNYVIVFSQEVSGFGLKSKEYYFLDFKNASSIYVDARESGKVKTSIYFDPYLITRLDNLKTGVRGKEEKKTLGSFQVYFTNDILSVIELDNEIKKFKNL